MPDCFGPSKAGSEQEDAGCRESGMTRKRGENFKDKQEPTFKNDGDEIFNQEQGKTDSTNSGSLVGNTTTSDSNNNNNDIKDDNNGSQSKLQENIRVSPLSFNAGSELSGATFFQELDGCRSCLESRGDCFEEELFESKPGLLYTYKENYKLKDFAAEVRATMDVEQFVHQAELILDLQEVSVEGIIGAMLEKVLIDERAPEAKIKEARGEIFVQGSSRLLAKTIQGVSAISMEDNSPATFEHDQSWLCALCELPTKVSRRHMVIARFKQPVNMGENAHEIRLFMLIITPSKDKNTKNAIETGRNFATMLVDSSFRRKLLNAKDETEFKSLMMLRAQRLAKTKHRLKNRHKYILDAAVHLSMDSLNYLNGEDCSLSKQGPCPLRRAQEQFRGLEAKSLARNKGDDLNVVVFNKHPRQSKLIDLISPATAAARLKISSELNLEQNNNNNFRNTIAADHETTSVEFGKQKGSGAGPSQSDKRPGGFKMLCSEIEFGRGLWGDFKRRMQMYPSDFKDAFVGPPKTIQKTVATIWFLYFGILLPTIAFSVLNTHQTHGHMGDLRKAIIGQAIGGLCFAYFGGQPLVIIMTTAPLCLYTKVIHQMCLDYGFHFPAMYAAVGLWNGFFLTIYSLFGFSKLMKWCTRSTEEIFALFIVMAFVTDAGKDLIKNFNRFYYNPACEAHQVAQSNLTQLLNQTLAPNEAGPLNQVCRRETSLLFVLLMLGTLWLATSLYKFRKTPYLEASKRELLADYALPTAVILMSFVGSFVFDEIYAEKFPPLVDVKFERAKIELLPTSGILISLGLGFTLSLLFFMDQNISAAMVNAPQNKLKKGCAYHFDLLVVGVLNGFLTLYGLPMMHGVLPHSPLHVRSLADIEERVEEGHLQEVILNVRETRVTGIVSHLLILATLLLIPYPIAYIPTSVLNGLFLYMAVTSLDGLQLFERILLLFTEQSKYPPNHYIRRCPQRNIHKFTLLQLIQLLVMCLFGFSPYNVVEMFFPVIIFLMIPFRHKIVTKYIDEKYLEALDGKH